MGNSIIGTAGHVDHGKTRLIKALTGIDADRLAEEKRRGITIELGFAYLSLPNGEKAGIIDVPGHEKFIGNMLAGAGSVDLALLVVAADEGFMPQTREHLGILSLLGVKRGIVALTKADLADGEMRELVKLDIEDEVAGTFLEHASVIPVSSVTGEGIEELRQRLFESLELAPDKNNRAPFRLPVDRVFSSEGFGAVVTGTLIEGRIAAGDEVTIYPSLHSARARNIQVHGLSVGYADCGRRVAVNLSGVKKENIARGDVIAAPGSMELSAMLDAHLSILNDTERTVANNSRLHFYHGAGSMLCRLILLDADELKKGQSAYAQLRLPAPVAAKPGDRFVLRFFSPVETVGGGVILDARPQKRARGDRGAIAGMAIKKDGSLRERIERAVYERSASFPSLKYIKRVIFNEDERFDAEVNALIESGALLTVAGDMAAHRDHLTLLGEKCRGILSAYHAENPLHAGMRKDELRTRLLPGFDQHVTDRVAELLGELKFVRIDGAFVANAGFRVSVSGGQARIRSEIVKIYSESGLTPPSVGEIALKFEKDKKTFGQVFEALIKEGELVALTPQICLHRDHYLWASEEFTRLAENKNEVTLGEFRDALGTSRKYAVAILEYFDRRGFTKKTGDARTLGGRPVS